MCVCIHILCRKESFFHCPHWKLWYMSLLDILFELSLLMLTTILQVYQSLIPCDFCLNTQNQGSGCIFVLTITMLPSHIWVPLSTWLCVPQILPLYLPTNAHTGRWQMVAQMLGSLLSNTECWLSFWLLALA